LRGLALLDDSLDVGPEPARVGGAESATGCAEGLAGYPRANEEIRDSTPRSPVERGDVRKDSRVVQGARFNLPSPSNVATSEKTAASSRVPALIFPTRSAAAKASLSTIHTRRALDPGTAIRSPRDSPAFPAHKANSCIYL